MENRFIKKVFLVLITLLMALSFAGCDEASEDELNSFDDYFGIDTEDVATQENETSESVTHFIENYEIAIVLDNSGSMYMGNNSKAWCRAKYAMEIFGSMLSYNQRDSVPGDVLTIYPMHAVTTDGSRPSDVNEGSTDPIKITSINDLNKISKMFTISAMGTPYTTVEKAYADLQNSSAPQKWLIVLTDGAFDSKLAADTGRSLASLANDDIKIQYLGIGEAASLSEYATQYFLSKKSSSSESLKQDIIDICNNIFQRDQLPSSALNGKKLTLDISMENLIVFVQGQNAKLKSLKDSSGKDISILLDSGQRKYSEVEYSALNYIGKPNGAEVDNTLSGQVVTFGKCSAGQYTLEYEDADSVQIFYTPNIDVALKFSDAASGDVIDITGRGEKLYPGEYILNYYLIDGVTKENVTDNNLIAPVVFDGGYITSNGVTYRVENGEKVVLEPDAATFLDVSATYLNNYKITTENRRNDYTVAIDYPPIDVDLKMKQEDGWYVKSDYDNWEPIVAKLTLAGKDLSDIQLANTELNVTFDEGKEVPYNLEKVPGESKILIHLGQDEDGDKVDTETDDYVIIAQAEYQSENKSDQLIGDADKEEFTISLFAKWMIIAAYILLALILLLLIYLIRNRKVFPTEMFVQTKTGVIKKFRLKGRSKKTDLLQSTNGSISCNIKKSCPWKWRNKNKATLKIYNLVPSKQITKFKIDGNEFRLRGTEFKNGMGESLSSLGELIVTHDYEITYTSNDIQNKVTIYMVKERNKKRKRK